MSSNRILGFTYRVVMLFLASLLVLSYLSALIDPEKLWLSVVFGLLFIPLATLNTIVLVWALMRRSKAFFIPLLALLPAFFFLDKHVQFHQIEDIQNEENIKIVSYNVGRFASSRYLEEQDRKSSADSIYDYILKQSPDIICLQEFYLNKTINLSDYLRTKFQGYYPTYYLYTGKYARFGNIILSKYPPKDKGVIKFDESANLSVYADYYIDGDNLRVYNCHLESYNVSLPALAKSLVHEEDEALKETEIKIEKSIKRRMTQVSQVLDHIEDSPIESMVCGDFNDIPMSYTYLKLSKSRKDTFKESGQGFGATYSKLWPLVRIDYVLCPKTYEVISHETPKVKYSDHYPVIAEVKI